MERTASRAARSAAVTERDRRENHMIRMMTGINLGVKLFAQPWP